MLQEEYVKNNIKISENNKQIDSIIGKIKLLSASAYTFIALGVCSFAGAFAFEISSFMIPAIIATFCGVVSVISIRKGLKMKDNLTAENKKIADVMLSKEYNFKNSELEKDKDLGDSITTENLISELQQIDDYSSSFEDEPVLASDNFQKVKKLGSINGKKNRKINF